MSHTPWYRRRGLPLHLITQGDVLVFRAPGDPVRSPGAERIPWVFGLRSECSGDSATGAIRSRARLSTRG